MRTGTIRCFGEDWLHWSRGFVGQRHHYFSLHHSWIIQQVCHHYRSERMDIKELNRLDYIMIYQQACQLVSIVQAFKQQGRFIVGQGMAWFGLYLLVVTKNEKIHKIISLTIS